MPLALSCTLLQRIAYFIPRLLLPGLLWGDMLQALADIDPSLPDPEFWRAWYTGWTSYAATQERLASQASPLTAQHAYHRAAIAYHWAEFMLFDAPLQKYQTRQQVSACFNKTLGGPAAMPWQAMTIDHASYPLPGFIAIPPCLDRVGCVILINGLDSAKEIELAYFAQHLFARGLAVCVFDGPGQGLLLGNTAMTLDFSSVIQSVLRALTQQPSIDLSRMGLLGVSFGGWLALKAASELGTAVAACVNLSGGFDLDNFAVLPQRLQRDFSYVFQQPLTTMAHIATQYLHLRGMSKPTCPILTVHGGLDQVFTQDSCDRVLSWCAGNMQLHGYPHEAHVCQHYFSEYIPVLADWLQTTLRSQTA